AWLAALEPDRRGDTLVPVLLDDIAAMNRVRAGQRLVDRLHRAGRKARGEQAVAERAGIGFAEHRREFGTPRIAVVDAILVGGQTGIGAEFGLADLLAEFPKGPVIADADEDVVGPRREDRIRHQIRMLVAGELRRAAVHEIVRRMRMHDRKTGLVQRGFEELPEPRTL